MTKYKMHYSREQLLRLNRSKLRAICEHYSIKAARSNLHTIDRICAVLHPIQPLNIQPPDAKDQIVRRRHHGIQENVQSLESEARESELEREALAISAANADTGPSTGMRIMVSIYNKHLLPYYLLLFLLLYYNCGSNRSGDEAQHDMTLDSCYVLLKECCEFVNGLWWYHDQSPSVSFLLNHFIKDRSETVGVIVENQIVRIPHVGSNIWALILLLIGIIGLSVSMHRRAA